MAAPIGAVWEASQAALQKLGFVPADIEEMQGSIETGFRPLAGNTHAHRTSGVARLVVERDEYAAGRGRLLLQLVSEDADRSRVRVAAELQAQVTKRGEIQYAEAGRGWSLLPLFTAWTTAQAGAQPDGWEGLTSNGVVEDEFLAALTAELSRRGDVPR